MTEKFLTKQLRLLGISDTVAFSMSPGLSLGLASGILNVMLVLFLDLMVVTVPIPDTSILPTASNVAPLTV